MTSSYYDVAIVGARLEPLLCGALLAKRGLRVLVLGQGEPDPDYLVDDYSLSRYPFPVAGASSSWVERIIEGLGLRQAVRQRLLPREPSFQAVVSNQRFDVFADEARFQREVVREYPDVRRQAEDLRRTLRQVNLELDGLLKRPLAWPPETFVERQRFVRALAMQRYNRAGDGWHPLRTLPQDHPFAESLRLALPFLCDLAPGQLSDFATTRLTGHVFGLPGSLTGGWGWLQEALVERIRSHSGDVRLDERAGQIDTANGAVRGVTLCRSGDDLGCGQLVLGTAVSDLLQLLSDRTPVLELFERVGEPRINGFRYTLNVVLRDKALSDAWRSDLVLRRHPRDLQDLTLWVEPRRVANKSHIVLCTTTVVPSHVVEEASYTVATYRERILEALRSVLPFMDQDLLLVDSPHDGLPPSRYPGGVDLEPASPWERGPQTMKPMYDYPERRAMGACGLPARTPVKGLFLANSQVVPGLGLEGSFLSAASVARLAGRRYRGQDWIRRGLWSADSVGI